MNSQKIDKWFSKKNENETKIQIFKNNNIFDKKVCYLYWESETEYKIQWLNKIPEIYNCSKIVSLRPYNNKITFVGLIKYKSTCNYIDLNDQFHQYFCRNKSFLKSHFQKCIRRGKIYKSLLSGYLWWEENMSDFLRRLPIIMIEDVALFREVEIIVWFMVMIDKINIPESFKCWLGSLIISLTKYPTKIFDGTKIDNFDLNGMEKLNRYQKNFIYSLLVRKSYGGMKGDMKMINYTINNYISLFLNNYNVPRIKIKNYNITRTLEPKDFEISGLDFHCFPKILELVHEKYPQYEIDLIKKTIWHCSSKINFREIYPKNCLEIIDCWNNIQQLVHRIQKQYIKRYIVKK